MKNEAYTYMAACNKAGIRVFPQLKYGWYYLVIEFNRTSDFLTYEVIKTKVGTVRYDPRKELWCEKILDLYDHFYHTKVAPKSGAA